MRQHRKGHYSCDFCRSRKLRCDRPLPCTNCVSRGKKCNFGQHQHQHQHQHQQLESPEAAAQTPPPSQTATPTVPNSDTLLAELQAFRNLAQDLEKRVLESADPQLGENDSNFSLLLSPGSRPDSASVDLSSLHLPREDGHLREVVARLERVSTCPSPPDNIDGEDLIFKVGSIRKIPEGRRYVMQSGRMTRCVWLPQYNEAKVLLRKYMANISYIHHIAHHPSLLAVVDDIYRRIDQQDPIMPGHAVLLLSIIASTTYVWTSDDDADDKDSLFWSPAEANRQTPLWIKATYDLLHAIQDRPPISLETIQGIIVLSFLVCNLEGVSLRYRSLISRGLFMSRELGLDRIDDGSTAHDPSIIQTEVGRRVWWYLAATNWLLAARHGGSRDRASQAIPNLMMVKRPLNINDADLTDHGLNPDLPISQPTEMSYFLQRLRLAEISRSIVDQDWDNRILSSSGKPRSRSRSHEQVVSMDAMLDNMINAIPSFLLLDNYRQQPVDTKNDGGAFVQAYLLSSIIQTQRCKLHIGYLGSRPSYDPAYVYSRDTCLRAARQIVRGEVQLERSQHVFSRVRLRLSGILHAVFMAGIVLLVDACTSTSNGTNLTQETDLCRGEAAEALRIIGEARSHSVAAASLHASLTQLLANFHFHSCEQQHHQWRKQSLHASSPGTGTGSAINLAAAAPLYRAPDANGDVREATLPTNSTSPSQFDSSQAGWDYWTCQPPVNGPLLGQIQIPIPIPMPMPMMMNNEFSFDDNQQQPRSMLEMSTWDNRFQWTDMPLV